MTVTAFLFQALNGLAGASALFLVAVGLSMIFGVTRIINLAHGSFYMLGAYVAYSFATRVGGSLGFWGGIVASALLIGALGAVIEIVLLRRIYRAPGLFQLLATFALVLVINDATLYLWGPEDLLGPRAPGLQGAVEILGRRLPAYDLFLIFVGPLVLLLVHVALKRTRFGRRLRAATQDREMLGALGVNQAILFTLVFALGAGLAAFGGALQMAREPANLGVDLTAISDAFVVVVIGGMGSITGAYLAAIIIAEVKTLCIAIGVADVGFATINFSKFTLVAEFLVLAAVLILRPYGLLGRAQIQQRSLVEAENPIRPLPPRLQILSAALAGALFLLPVLAQSAPYLLILGIDVLIAVIFATSLHFIAGPGGMHSFGHAAYFGLGAYGAALLVKWLNLPMGAGLMAASLTALAGALLFGWFAVRLSGIYLAMLTLAFAQIVWAAVFQWEEFTGGSNGVIGVWPPPPFDKAWAYFLLTATCAIGCVWFLRHILFAPFGYAMRAGRDSPLRAEAIGIDVKRVQWLAFAMAGAIAGLAGGVFAFAKGSISPEAISIGRSIDGLVMVLLGGIQTLTGPVAGAFVFSVLEDLVMRQTHYWRALLGAVILVLVLAFPQGIVGTLARLVDRVRARVRARL
jgi:branched-chain amino acid transport system permease protein